MNILFVHHNCMIPTRGGTERVAYTVAKALQQRGHEIHFLAITETSPISTAANPDEQLFLPKLSNDDEKLQYIREICAKYNIQFIVNELGDSDNFNIFSKHNFENIKIVSCLHFDIYGQIKFYKERIHSPSKWKQAIWDALYAVGINGAQITYFLNKRRRMRKMIQSSHAVVVPTATVVKQLKRFTGMYHNHIYHLDNPYPFDFKNRKKDYKKQDIILFAGRLSAEKQVHILISAWASLCKKLPKWELIILGEGKQRKELEELAHNLRCQRLSFLGNVKNIEDYYASAKILALPSAHECTGGVVLEALAHYVHPVVFHYPSAHEFIRFSQLGAIVRKKSSKSFSKHLQHAISKWDIEKQYLIDDYIVEYELSRIVDKWEDLFLHI